MRDDSNAPDSGVDHSKEAHRTTRILTEKAVEGALAERKVPRDYVILWREGDQTFQWSWRGPSAERLRFMREALRIDVENGQWAAGHTCYVNNRPCWRICGTSSGLVKYMKSMPLPNSKTF